MLDCYEVVTWLHVDLGSVTWAMEILLSVTQE